MKTILFLLSFISIFIISCGSENKKSYTISDDHNGTKSPRVKKVTYQTSDNNKSEETVIQYTYNKDNLLISKKESLSITPKDGDKYVQEITYTYNDNKQLKTRKFISSDFNRFGSNTTYSYGDIIYINTKLPAISTEHTTARNSSCIREYEYNLNQNNFATTISSIAYNCHRPTEYPGFPKDNYTYTYNAHGKIYSIKHTTTENNLTDISTYSYTTTNKIKEVIKNKNYKRVYTYDKNDLLQTVESYSRSDNNETYKIDGKRIYSYENKPHYHKQAPTFLDIYNLDFTL